MRRFVVIGQRACASPDFSLVDLAGTSGRLDVLVRCVRAALLHSHGVRTDTRIYLVLGGGPAAPRTLRFDGATAKFLRPDERALATLVQKSLAHDVAGAEFVTVRPGIALANDGLDAVLRDVGDATLFVLEETGVDVRTVDPAVLAANPVFFIGDDLGFEPSARQRLSDSGARAISIGPTSVHAEDVVTVLANELDRRRL